MEINAIQCNNCLEILYSRSRYDMRVCICGGISIDGGFDYCKISGSNYNRLIIDSDKLLQQILHYDWNLGNDCASEFLDGYHGKFKITKNSNKKFFNELIIDGEVIYEK